MKKLNLNIDYKRSEAQVRAMSNADLTLDYLGAGVRSVHPELHGQLLRTWGRIQRKLEAANQSKLDTVDIEETEYDFLKKPVEEGKFPSHLAMYVLEFQDNIFIND